MKKFLVLLVLVIAVAMPFVSGCSAKRPVTMTMTPQADRVHAAIVEDVIDHFDLVLRNIHVYPQDGGTTGAVVLANEATVDLSKIWFEQDTPVLSTTLPEGTYYDLTLTFWKVDIAADFGFGSFDLDFLINPDKGITMKYDNTELVVDEDGAEIVWAFDANCMIPDLGGITVISDYGTITIK